MSDFVDKCCIHCYEKVQTTREKEDSPPEKTMSCKHAEDVCQHCLEKVQTSTEDSPPLLTAKEKRNRILWDFSFLAAGGVLWYLTTKWCSNIAIESFDSILDTIATPTE